MCRISGKRSCYKSYILCVKYYSLYRKKRIYKMTTCPHYGPGRDRSAGKLRHAGIGFRVLIKRHFKWRVVESSEHIYIYTQYTYTCIYMHQCGYMCIESRGDSTSNLRVGAADLLSGEIPSGQRVRTLPRISEDEVEVLCSDWGGGWESPGNRDRFTAPSSSLLGSKAGCPWCIGISPLRG